MTVEFNTPPGRIVWGNPAKSTVKKDQKTRQPIMRDGKQVEQWVFGLAIDKQNFNQFVMPYLQQEVASVFPHGVPPQFSWKFKDGDGVDRSGKPFNTREGYAGHYVLTISTEAFAPQIFKLENGRYRQMAPEEVKCGDYVVVKLNVKANMPTNQTHTPGIYVNPVGIEHIGSGAEIVSSGGDPDEMFGGRTYQLPPGASAVPVAPQAAVAVPYTPPVGTGAPYQAPPAPYAMPPQQPAPVYAQPPAPTPPAPVYPAPAHDFVHNAGQPPAATPYAMPPQQPAPVYAQPPAPYAVPPAQPAAPYNPHMPPGIPQGR